MPHEGKVYLDLFGRNFDPTKLDLSIAPTKITVEADPHPKYSAWIFSSERVVSDLIDIYAMSASVVAALKSHESAIMAAIKAHQLEAILEVVLTISPDDTLSMPAIGFDSEVLGFVNRLGGSIDVDTYRAAS